VDISSLLANPQIGAVLHLGQPSVAVMGASDVLYGLRPPAGRMVQTVYPSNYATSVSPFDFGMRPGPSAWPAPGCSLPAARCPNGTNPGRSHRFYTGRPVVPFGFGLSYSRFRYTIASAPRGELSLDSLREYLGEIERKGRNFLKLDELAGRAASAQFVVNVTNIGGVDADDVVLGFLSPPGAGTAGLPLQSLFGFERVHVPARSSVSVLIELPPHELAFVDSAGRRRALSGEYTVRFGLRETASIGMGLAECRLRAQ
jgi:beta-D-xylosidase 4